MSAGRMIMSDYERKSYQEWRLENREMLLSLFGEYQAESGDSQTTFEYFCQSLFAETTYGRADA